MRCYFFSSLVLLLNVCVVSADNENTISNAKELFEKYVALEKAFDPALADLYADDARIENTFVKQDGTTRLVKIPAADYKKLIRTKMATVKARGATDTYYDVKYTIEGKLVRLNCLRLSQPNVSSTPFSMLFGPGKDGKWLILEEISQSRG